MNRIYRSIWNEVTRTFVAAAEKIRSRGKRSSAGGTAECSDAALRTGGLILRDGATAAAPPMRRPLRAGMRPLALEQRFMFDGAAVATTGDAMQADDATQTLVGAHAWVHAGVPAAQSDTERSTGHDTAPADHGARMLAAGDPAVNGGRLEVVFVEDNVTDYQTLTSGMKAGLEIVVLDSKGDGLRQMADYLDGRSGIDAIHILSHGAEGRIDLGSLTLDSAAVTSRMSDLVALGSALSTEGDLLLYGCEVAGGEGQAFLSAMASATGADVAASTDLTGTTQQGGDWVLEAATGLVESDTPVMASAQAVYAGVLASANLTAGNDAPALSADDDTITASAST